jgi:hypothetical protein
MICAAMGSAAVTASAEPLSTTDREALLERLEKIRDIANEKIDSRYRLAISAFQEAASSNEAATEFFLKCVEKVEFPDQNRRNADFREWKHKEEGKLKSVAHAAALRLQLRWLILSLRATSERADRKQLGVEAATILDAIASEYQSFKEHQNLLQQGVLGSIFAKAYDLGGVKLEKWPQAPLPVGQVFEQVLMPPHRNAAGLATLKDLWNRRIQMEMTMRQDAPPPAVGKESRRVGLKEEMTPEFKKFRENDLPNLKWQMEMDLFKYGDESAAAVRMLQQIESMPAHESVQEWTEQLGKLLSPYTP